MRASGILMPIFSLPSDHGIGTLGKSAYDFVDFLSMSGQTYWQILPICPTGFGDSPYQSCSAYAGNPYFIDLDMLRDDGLLEKSEYDSIVWCTDNYHVDYEKLYNNRFTVLKKAYQRFKNNIPEDYEIICKECIPWLDSYALFMAIKDANDGKPWYMWNEPLKMREPSALEKARQVFADEIGFYRFLNYKFSKQWFALKKYANLKNVYIIGDMPIYVSYDSADVWANPEQFKLNDDLTPTSVAGCPPDAFSDDGQLWGNPLYDWEYMKNKSPKYQWWRSRIAYCLDMYDMIRIDHFRAFESYYSIPYGSSTAKDGEWIKGPGMDFFDCLKDGFGELPIIAEDLGIITDDVRQLLKDSGFPGMKVLQSAFDSKGNSSYLPHNHIKNCVLYTGTHDNDTIIGWSRTQSDEDMKFAIEYMRVAENESLNWAMIKTAFSSVADTVIIPIQDYMGLDSDSRINTPSKIGKNWQWRIDGGCINSWLAKIIYDNTVLYRRIPKLEKKFEKE